METSAMAANCFSRAAGVYPLGRNTSFSNPSTPSSLCAKCSWHQRPVWTTRLICREFIRRRTEYSFPRWPSSSRIIPSLVGNHSRVFAANEGVPSEILEDSKFVPITEEDPRFGPPALLLMGFANEEAIKVQTLLKDMEGDFMQVLLFTEEMAGGTLGNAVNVVQPNLAEVQVAQGLPRISFISGLTGEEIMMLVQVFPDAGLEPTVFAAHVPLNSEKPIKELIDEIMDDHQRLNPASAKGN